MSEEPRQSIKIIIITIIIIIILFLVTKIAVFYILKNYITVAKANCRC